MFLFFSPARREPVPPQFGIGWKELLGDVLQVLVLAPSGSANEYAGFIVEEDRLVVWTDRFVVGQTDSLLDSHHSYSEKSQSFIRFCIYSHFRSLHRQNSFTMIKIMQWLLSRYRNAI